MIDREDDAAVAHEVSWKTVPEAHDYPAAASYLSLLAPAAVADEVVRRLRAATVEEFAAKDVLRAATLPLLPVDNVHVASDLAKVKQGKSLSPVLMVRGDLLRGLPLQIAD